MPIRRSPERSVSRRGLQLAGVAALASVGLVAGWSAFWFLCDDSYIAFRHVSNSVLGHGYVWNPPPFRPVEGYSSFLWVVLLDVAWRLGGVEPPDSANPLSLAFSFGTLAVTGWMVLRMPLSQRLDPHRVPLLALVLLGILTNRTFLAWTSSGLETAMFGFLVLAWAAVGALGRASLARDVGLAVLASLLVLARPDGMLYALVTAAMLAGSRRSLLPWVAFALPAAHLSWRLSLYGYPLPNPAYAKHTAPWPGMGALYALSFCLEYGLVVAAAWCVALIPRARAAWEAVRIRAREDQLRLLVGVALVGHLAYYTLRIGGDHFEYRVYAAHVPLIYIAAVWVLDQLALRIRPAAVAFAVLLLAGWPLPWLHWWGTHTATDRGQFGLPTHAVAQHLPLPMQPVALLFDAVQEGMIGHWVGMRHQTHVIYGMHVQPRENPTRAEGSRIRSEDDILVMSKGGVGYTSWVLPHVAVLDYRGLCDVVGARTPVKERPWWSWKGRTMAHERMAPRAYLACFEPNVTVSKKGVVTVRERPTPLTAEQVRDCEVRFLAKVEGR